MVRCDRRAPVGEVLAIERRLVALSKVVAHALRHAPHSYGLALDATGAVPVDELVAALRRTPRWRGVTRADLDRVIADSGRQRFEIADDRIRALYGHSLPARLDRRPAVPPARLFHGTTPAAAAVIAREGLRAMARQSVHLSTDVETAMAVGARRTATPVVLVVDAADARAAGVVFYRGGAHVWLADEVPGRFVRPLDR